MNANLDVHMAAKQFMRAGEYRTRVRDIIRRRRDNGGGPDIDDDLIRMYRKWAAQNHVAGVRWMKIAIKFGS